MSTSTQSSLMPILQQTTSTHLPAERRGQYQTYPDYTAAMGSAGEDSDCALLCPSLRNQQELCGFLPVLTSPLPAFSALSWTVALNTSKVAEHPSCRARKRLGSEAELQGSSGGQWGGHEECECHRLWARLSPQAGERGRVPGDISFSFCGDDSVSCVSAAAGQGMCLLLLIVWWHLH